MKSFEKKIMHHAALFIFLFVLGTWLQAAAAFPGQIKFEQKDGTIFEGNLKGDEWFNWIALPNEYIAVFNPSTNRYEYARIETHDGAEQLVPSGTQVDEQLHLLHPEKLIGIVPPIDKATLYELHKRAKKAKYQHEHSNETLRSKKKLDINSTQWKEVLKKDPPE